MWPLLARDAVVAGMGPKAILAAGGGAVLGILVSGGLIGAITLAVLAWVIAVAIPVGRRHLALRGPGTIDPFSLREPWRQAVQEALAAQNRFRQATAGIAAGPLKDRLGTIGAQLEGVSEAGRVARRGQTLEDVRRQIDTALITSQLAQVESQPDASAEGSNRERTAEALRAQLETAARIDGVLGETRDRLGLLDARLDEAVARSLELSVRTDDPDQLGGVNTTVDEVLEEMEALRLALDEADGGGQHDAVSIPGDQTPSGDETAEDEVSVTTVTTTTARLVRSSAVVGIGTGLSRLSGLLRVGALTFAVGATALSDTYNLANTTPNIIYELLLGGVLSASLVPIFVEHDQHGDAEATNAVVTVAFLAMLILTVVAIVAAPFIVDLYTWRLPSAEAAAQAEVAVPLLRLFVPQILFYGLMTLGTALLNARRSFFAPAYAPILNNVVVIGVLLAFAAVASSNPSLSEVADDQDLLLLLGLGTTAGIVAMTVALWPAIRHAGIRLRFNPAWRHPAIRTVARLSGWTIGYAVANQIALFVVLALANGEGAGAVSAYTYAFIFFQLPHGLFAVSIMTTFMPDLAGLAAVGDLQGFRERFALGLRLLTLVVLPAAVGYIVLARPLVAMLLERGAFGGGSSQLTAEVLVAFSLGLLGFSVYLLVLRGFYAFKDTRTPFMLNLAENGVNIVAALALVGALGVQGLALAYALAYSFGAVLSLAALRRRVGGLDGRRTIASVSRMVAAAGVMAVAVWATTQVVGSDDGTGAVVRTVVGVVVGVVVYALALFALRVPEMTQLVERLQQRGRPPAPREPLGSPP